MVVVRKRHVGFSLVKGKRMAKFIGVSCKRSRRVGFDLGLKSRYGKFLKEKCKLNTAPGQHGLHKRKASDYSLQLTAKQTIKYMYGILEKQFNNYYKKAYNSKGSTGLNLLELVESRLDNVVYRMGFAATRAEARQLVNHKLVMVTRKGFMSGSCVDIPSYLVKPEDLIYIRVKAQKQERIIKSLNYCQDSGFADWVNVDIEKMSGVLKRLPRRDELSVFINERLVVEFYSK